MDPIRPVSSLGSGCARIMDIDPGPRRGWIERIHRRKRLCDCQAALQRTPGNIDLGLDDLGFALAPSPGRGRIGQQGQAACRPAPHSRGVQIRSTRLGKTNSHSSSSKKGFFSFDSNDLRLICRSGTPGQTRNQIQLGPTAIGDDLLSKNELLSSNPVATFGASESSR